MNDQVKTEEIKKDEAAIQENYEDKYWMETYGVSSEELKNSGKNLGIEDKIIKASFANKVFA